MKRIISKNNFFDNPDEIRDIVLSLDNWTFQEDVNSYGWKGRRTECLSNSISQNIFDYVWDEMDLDNWRYPEWDTGNYASNGSIAGAKISNPTISSYFHIATEGSKNGYADWQDRYHKDFLPCAGVVYLNSNPPSGSGTSIVDADNNKFINMENEYNKLVAYDGYCIHGASNFFGDCKLTGRMTLNFFIHEKGYAK